MKRLTKTFQTTDPNTLDDFLACTMATIEDGLLQSGFEPGKDYSAKDLFQAAMPIVYERWKSNSLTITTGWPFPE